MVVCGRCGGFNNTNVICPECGSKPFKVNPKEVSSIPLESIPKYYQNRFWEKDIFWKFHKEDLDKDKSRIFTEQMDKVHTMFKEGNLPNRSAIFVAPAGFSKMTWAYSCMQFALKFGYTTAPILDSAELKRFLVLSSEKVFSTYLDLDYNEYLSQDILFITITKTEQRRGSANIIVELLDKRARMGKPTFFISRYSIYELSYWDKNNDFIQIKSDMDNGDPLKVPAVISSF